MVIQDGGEREGLVNRRYRVLKQLGAGGMGAVYLVEDTLDEDQQLALKTIRTGVDSAFNYKAFRNEFQAMTQFHHPNVVEVYEFGNIGAQEDFFTMEVIEGTNLLDACAGADLLTIYDYAIQIGRALEYIHSQGFVHFDLKPDNVMVRRDGVVKVMDFGLVEDVNRRQPAMIKGSVHYIAPEMVRGDAVDHRFDLYSLGAVLFHVITGRPPFDGEVMQILQQHVTRAVDFETDVKRPLPEPLRALLARLLAKDPAARPSSASEFIVDMGRISGRRGAVQARDVAESYVLGSRFVGRDAELARLKEAFDRRVGACDPAAPPLYLVTGAAGMGRSRLVQEFRHHVQLRGVRFAHGSSLQNGGQPCLPFSEIIHALVREILPSTRGVELTTLRNMTPSYVIPGRRSDAGSGGDTKDPAGDAVTIVPTSAPVDAVEAARPAASSAANSTGATISLRRTGSLRRTDDAGPRDSTSMRVLFPAPPPATAPLAGPTGGADTALENELLTVLLRASAAALCRLLPEDEALRELAPEPPPAFSGPRAEKDWLLDSICRFLVDASRVRPLVLYVSDLHWADELTVELLARLARALGRTAHEGDPAKLLLLGCYRAEETAGSLLEKTVAELVDGGAAATIALQPMVVGELRHMLHSMLGPVSLSDEAAALLLARTGGNPFLIEAMVRGLLEQGAILRKGTDFVIADEALRGGAALGSVAEVIDGTLARLPTAEREVLELLAVFNRPTSAPVLQLAGGHLTTLGRVLSRLQKKRFLQRGWSDGGYQYRLRHNQLGAHLYGGLGETARRRLHEAAGHALEARYGTSDRYLEDLSRHFHAARSFEKSVSYARAAADQARRLYDFKRAGAHYLQAYETLEQLAPSAPRRLLEAELAVAIAECSFYSPSEAHIDRLERAAAIAGERGDVELTNRILNAMGRTWYALGKQKEAIRCFQEFARSIAGTADDLSRAVPFAVLGRVYFFLARFEQARDYLDRAIALLRGLGGAEEDVSYALGMCGAACAFLGDLTLGRARIEESVAIGRSINHQTRIGIGLIYDGICLAHHGHWSDARARLREGLAICERTGDVIGIGTGSSFLGDVLLAEGDHDAAIRSIRLGREAIARAGGTWTFTMIGTHLAEAQLAAGHVDEALATATETLACLETGERWGESCLCVALGRIHAARGASDEARRWLARALESARSQHARPFEAKAHLATGELLRSAGATDEARASLETARAMFADLGMGWYAARAAAALHVAAPEIG